MYSKRNFAIKGDLLYIGCKSKTIKEWDAWFKSDEEFETPRNTPEFKQIHAMYLAYKSYIKALK
jgi:hypothetical protein